MHAQCYCCYAHVGHICPAKPAGPGALRGRLRVRRAARLSGAVSAGRGSHRQGAVEHLVKRWGNAGKMVGKGMKCWENGGFTLENDGFTLEHVRNCGRTIGKW